MNIAEIAIKYKLMDFVIDNKLYFSFVYIASHTNIQNNMKSISKRLCETNNFKMFKFLIDKYDAHKLTTHKDLVNYPTFVNYYIEHLNGYTRKIKYLRNNIYSMNYLHKSTKEIIDKMFNDLDANQLYCILLNNSLSKYVLNMEFELFTKKNLMKYTDDQIQTLLFNCVKLNNNVCI